MAKKIANVKPKTEIVTRIDRVLTALREGVAGLSREQYREVLEEVAADIEARLQALKEDAP